MNRRQLIRPYPATTVVQPIFWWTHNNSTGSRERSIQTKKLFFKSMRRLNAKASDLRFSSISELLIYTALEWLVILCIISAISGFQCRIISDLIWPHHLLFLCKFWTIFQILKHFHRSACCWILSFSASVAGSRQSGQSSSKSLFVWDVIGKVIKRLVQLEGGVQHLR